MSFFLRRVNNGTEAEDLTQQVFLRLLGMADPERIENTEAFVFKIATNLLRDRSRVAIRRNDASILSIDTAVVSEVTHEFVEDLSPERVFLARESLVDVLKSLDELGEKTRDIFILFRLENMKQKEIADLLGIGVSTVEKHVMRATMHLARKYGAE